MVVVLIHSGMACKDINDGAGEVGPCMAANFHTQGGCIHLW